MYDDYVARLNKFQFTPLREGRPAAGTGKGNTKLFQFTPLREGRRAMKIALLAIRTISIHAPPRGATTTKRYFPQDKIFQFTPLREGRLRRQRKRRPAEWYFNSRPSARGDATITDAATGQLFQFTPLREGRRYVMVSQWVENISIHAPPRGATAKDMQFLQIFCSTLTNQHGLTIVPGNLSRLFW